MNKRVILFVLLIINLMALPVSQAHDKIPPSKTMNLEQLTTAFGWNLENAEITTQKIADNLYVLFGVGGNIAVSLGEDGVFIVDDQFPQLMPKIKEAISEIGGDEINFAVTTHWHFDHAEGNLTLGPEGTWLVAHKNSREMMKQDHVINLVLAAYKQNAYPESAWPDVTFKDEMQFHLNGQQIDLFHFGPAHTTGDAAVVFRGANAVHMGDVFNNAGYPFIDSGNGGELEGMIKFCQETLKRIDSDTIVIPGHGPVTNYQAMQDYVDMLITVRDRLKKLTEQGATLEQVIAAKLTAEFDQSKGDSRMFIDRAYHSMAHEHE